MIDLRQNGPGCADSSLEPIRKDARRASRPAPNIATTRQGHPEEVFRARHMLIPLLVMRNPVGLMLRAILLFGALTWAITANYHLKEISILQNKLLHWLVDAH